MEELLNMLKSLTADAVALTYKAKGFHWNVEGDDFPQWHSKLDEIYEDLDGAIDTFAEWIRMLDENADKDLYLRHAAVTALARMGNADKMVELAQSPKRHLRIAAVLVLRRLKSEKIAVFLNDPDNYIVTETARAIHDDRSIPKRLPELAQLLSRTDLSSEPLLRRCISAAQRAGTVKELELVIAFANRKDIAPVLRAEAMATLGTWAEPSVVDRVDGYYRGPVRRDPNPVRAKLSLPIENWLKESDPTVLAAVAKMIQELSMKNFNATLASLYIIVCSCI